MHRGSGRKIGKLEFILKEINSRLKKLDDYKKKLGHCIALSDGELNEFEKDIEYSKAQL